MAILGGAHDGWYPAEQAGIMSMSVRPTPSFRYTSLPSLAISFARLPRARLVRQLWIIIN